MPKCDFNKVAKRSQKELYGRNGTPPTPDQSPNFFTTP